MPTPYAAVNAPNEGALRFSGMWGAAYRDGKLLMEVVEVSGQVSINRVDVPLVGRSTTGHKRGRETREGQLTVQKIDSKWEMEIYSLIALSVSDRRAARDSGQPITTAFNLQLEYDDPDALGEEKWQLNSVQLWDLPLGFNIGDDLVSRQFTMTWESETPIKVFTAITDSATGAPVAQEYQV